MTASVSIVDVAAYILARESTMVTLKLHKLAFYAQAEVHRADWKKYGRAAGPIRNKQMVELGADLCLAFPDHPKGHGSRGTWNCVKLAQQAGIPVLVVWNQRLWVYNPDHPTHGTHRVLDPYTH